MTVLAEAPPRASPVSVTDPRPHAVVIGSGFGGLAAAVRLGARGYRVTVLERLDRPGGRARDPGRSRAAGRQLGVHRVPLGQHAPGDPLLPGLWDA